MPQPQAQDILALEEQLTRASQAVDVDALDHLYAEDVMLTNVLGETACGKAALIDEAKRGVAMRQQAAAGGTPIATTYR
jgi:ketosteroid isomerase-like protein